MAITLNVGGSKKVSQNYDSQGVSLNVTAEVSEPEKVADAANELFDLVNHLLDEQIAVLSRGEAKAISTTPSRNGGRSQSNGSSGQNQGRGLYRSSNRSNGNGSNSNGGNRNPDRKLTQAQHRAITNMTKRLDEQADAWVSHEFGVDKLDDLNVRQASEFIDTLKAAFEERQLQSQQG